MKLILQNVLFLSIGVKVFFKHLWMVAKNGSVGARRVVPNNEFILGTARRAPTDLSFIKLVLFVLISLVGSSVFAQTIEPEISKKLNDFLQETNEKLKDQTKINLLVQRVPDGAPVFDQGGSEFIHMASVQKLMISYAALKNLGADYTFSTEVYSNWEATDQVDDFNAGIAEGKRLNEIEQKVELFIRPYGNPLLQHEDLFLIAKELKARGYKKIDSLVVDKSLFIDPIEAKGSECYQAAQTVTALEFNCYRVDIFPGALGQAALVNLSPGFYGEITNRVKTLSSIGINISTTQIPDNSIYLGKGFPRNGIWRPTKFKLQLDGKIGIKEKPSKTYFSHPEPDSFFMHALKSALEERGIQVEDKMAFGLVPKEAKLVYEHVSAPLTVIIKSLNNYSNNFIAGQLLYAIGQEDNGLFSMEKGLQNMRETLNKLPNFDQGGNIIDASGLSVENKVSANQILTVLKEAYADFGVQPAFTASLPRFGDVGSLARRNLLSDKEGYQALTSIYTDQMQRASAVWAKPGAVEGVSAVSGYLETQSHQRVGFSITLTGKIKKNEASEIEDDIIRILLGLERRVAVESPV